MAAVDTLHRTSKPSDTILFLKFTDLQIAYGFTEGNGERLPLKY